MSNKDFFKKLQGAEKDFDSAKSGSSGGYIEAVVGKHIVRGQSIDLNVSQDGTPFVVVNSIVVQSSEGRENVGLRVAQRIDLKEHTWKKADGSTGIMTRADKFNQLCRALRAFGYDTSDMSIEDLDDVQADFADDQNAARCEVTQKDGSEFKNVKWGKPVEDDDDLPAIEDVLDDDDDDMDDDDDEDMDDDNDDQDDSDSDDDDDDDDDDDQDDDDEDDEDDFEPPVKNDIVDAKPKGTKKVLEYKVKTVNKKRETCTLVREKDGKEFKDVSWSLLS